MLRRTFLLAGSVLAHEVWAGWARAWAQESFSAAIGVLASERSLAEQGAAFLKAYAPDDIDGRALYAQAKAAFDGLIEQLLADLAQARDPQISDGFRTQVQRAVERRLAFSERVDADMKQAVPQGAKPGFADALAASAGELVKQIFAGGVSVWHEWRDASADRRREISARIEAQRWRPFADIQPVR
jgi:hypothetical protein